MTTRHFPSLFNALDYPLHVDGKDVNSAIGLVFKLQARPEEPVTIETVDGHLVVATYWQDIDMVEYQEQDDEPEPNRRDVMRYRETGVMV